MEVGIKMEENTAIKENILEAALLLFNEKGLRFTMDDLAQSLGMSKKTIYKVFKDKEAVLKELIQECFSSIKAGEKELYDNQELDIIEKLKQIIIVLPTKYQTMDFRQIYSLDEKYPKLMKKIEARLENDWELTIDLLKKGMEEGRIRTISIPIFKAMVEGSIEHFLTRSMLMDEGIRYETALEEMVNLLIDGIRV